MATAVGPGVDIATVSFTTPTLPVPGATRDSGLAGNPWIAAVSAILATAMDVLDTAIASVALPYIAGSLAALNSEAT